MQSTRDVVADFIRYTEDKEVGKLILQKRHAFARAQGESQTGALHRGCADSVFEQGAHKIKRKRLVARGSPKYNLFMLIRRTPWKIVCANSHSRCTISEITYNLRTCRGAPCHDDVSIDLNTPPSPSYFAVRAPDAVCVEITVSVVHIAVMYPVNVVPRCFTLKRVKTEHRAAE